MHPWIYLLCTYLLSGIGFFIYRALRSRYSFRQRKLLITSVVFLSLTLPLGALYFVSDKALELEAPVSAIEPQVTDPELARVLVVFDPNSGNSRINEHNVSIFEQNQVYNWFIANGSKIERGGLFAMGIAGLLLFLQLSYLFVILLGAKRREIILDGKNWQLLYSDFYDKAASFKILKGYILWSETLDRLPAAEQTAILEHEISHLRQRNTWELIGLDTLRIAWLLNPVFYFLKREWIKLSEFIADQEASQRLGDKAAYAKLLLSQQEIYEPARPAYLMAFREHPLHERIRLLATGGGSSKWKLWPVMLVLGMSMSITAAYSTSLAAEQEREFKAYEICYCINHETGQLIFCDDCFTEGLDCACIEPPE